MKVVVVSPGKVNSETSEEGRKGGRQAGWLRLCSKVHYFPSIPGSWDLSDARLDSNYK